MKTQKIPRKLIEKERTRMSKRQKKALAEKISGHVPEDFDKN